MYLLTTRYLEAAQPLIELIGDYTMVMTLPKNTPTLEGLATKDWTRPDNIFCSEHTIGLITKCDTDPTNRGPYMDHFPILTTLDIPTRLCPPVITRNYNDVNWGKFNDTLHTKLAEFPLYMLIVTDIEFQATTRNLTCIIKEMIEEHVPLSKPCPLSKRWWNCDLTKMKQAASKLTNRAYKLRGLPEHPIHEEHHSMHNQYSEAVKKAKREHWEDWLEHKDSEDIWIANKYINLEPNQSGPSCIPTLDIKWRDGTISEAKMNEQKALVLAETFFPPPPAESAIPDDFIYPELVPSPGSITEEQLLCCIHKLSPLKLLGPDGIRNIVFKKCIKTLVLHLARLFQAILLLKMYYPPWRDFTTVVLCKPGKPNYNLVKAYCPIALLNTTGKLLTAVIAD